MAKTKTTQPQLAAMLNVSPRTLWASLHGFRDWSDAEKKTIDEFFKTIK